MADQPSSVPAPPTASIAELVERSAALKGELVAYTQGPRFDRQLTARLYEAADRYDGELDEGTAVLVIDYFALQHRLPDGRTVVERFVAQRRPPLSEQDTAMMLGWRDVVEGTFEVREVDGDALIARNLLDDLVYRIHSNMGRSAFAALRPGAFVVGRLVPLHPDHDAWLVSGHLATFPAAAGPELAPSLVRMVTEHPELAFRNPELRRRAEEMLAEDRADFIAHFGEDLVILPPEDVERETREHYRRRRDKALEALGPEEAEYVQATGVAPEELFRLTGELCSAADIGVIYDEAEGLNFYADFGLLDALFADPSLARNREAAGRLRSYLSDDSVSPLPIRRLVARHPEGADQVFRTVLGKPRFSWERDGEELLRRRKKRFFEQPPSNGMTVLGDRLAELLRAGRAQSRHRQAGRSRRRRTAPTTRNRL